MEYYLTRGRGSFPDGSEPNNDRIVRRGDRAREEDEPTSRRDEERRRPSRRSVEDEY